LVLLPSLSSAQKVGVVLSGGGASGVAHIGVLKALEEKNIPIDYITGTSMGALVGALYASGYSPLEIEAIFLTDQFKDWGSGILNEKYQYYLRKKQEDASLVNFKLELDTTWENSIPLTMVSSAAIDMGLMEYFAPISAKINNNFNDLFVPFRCVASDIISKKSITLKDGRLETAVRASMSYPLFISPVTKDNMLLFDGGLYNNFPSDVLCNEFSPEFIIGSRVSANFQLPDEDNVISQVKSILVENSDYSIPCGTGILISPDAENFSTFNFNNNKELIEIGYQATLLQIDSIYGYINTRTYSKTLDEKRRAFRERTPKLVFDEIEVTGLTDAQNKYIRKTIRFKKDTIGIRKIEAEYIKVSSDDKIKQIYPLATYNKETGYFSLNLKAKKEKNLFVSFGGVFSSSPINEGFVGLQYNWLGMSAITSTANSYFGKLYNSVYADIRFDMALNIPFYWEIGGTLSSWDYFKSSTTFFEDIKPSFLVIRDRFIHSEIGFPVAYKGKIVAGGSVGRLENEYYQTKEFTSLDTTDITGFSNSIGKLEYERNSLNQKQYATEGSYFFIGGKYISGTEETLPGSTSINKNKYTERLEWAQFKINYTKYFIKKSKVNFGIMGEGVFSEQPFFNNYTATILSAPAFQPIAESKTLFQDRFRAHSYASVGVKTIFSFVKNTQLRLGGYVYQPYKEILEDENKKAYYGKEFAKRFFIGSFTGVYYTPIGPLALSVNYYDKTDEPWSFMFHFGYIIFNKKSFN